MALLCIHAAFIFIKPICWKKNKGKMLIFLYCFKTDIHTQIDKGNDFKCKLVESCSRYVKGIVIWQKQQAEATAVDTEKIQILIKSNNGFFSEHKSEMILKWLNLIVDQKTRNLGKSA